MTIGEQIKAQLKKKKWSQARLAREAGITEAAVSQIINGGREPQFSTILSLLAVIDLDLKRVNK